MTRGATRNKQALEECGGGGSCRQRCSAGRVAAGVHACRAAHARSMPAWATLHSRAADAAPGAVPSSAVAPRCCRCWRLPDPAVVEERIGAGNCTHPCLHATMSAVCFLTLTWSMHARLARSGPSLMTAVSSSSCTSSKWPRAAVEEEGRGGRARQCVRTSRGVRTSRRRAAASKPLGRELLL